MIHIALLLKMKYLCAVCYQLGWQYAPNWIMFSQMIVEHFEQIAVVSLQLKACLFNAVHAIWISLQVKAGVEIMY